jgi:multiple sugar transport system permease protein
MTPRRGSPGRRNAGRWLIVASSCAFGLVVLAQALRGAGIIELGFDDWRPTLYAYVLWGIALGAGLVMTKGERGHQLLFLLPALLFTVAVVIFPTFFGLYIAFTDWNLSSVSGRAFNGIDNIRTLLRDAFFWNALGNMVWYVLAVLVQYAIAFGLALLLNAEIRARRFFRVAFLLPFMLSPVAVSWMIGKSIYGISLRPGRRAGASPRLGRPAFFASPWLARSSIMAMDAWVWIPFIDLAARRAAGAASRSGGGRGSTVRAVADVLEDHLPAHAGQHHGRPLQIIFELKLADIIISVTAGGLAVRPTRYRASSIASIATLERRIRHHAGEFYR